MSATDANHEPERKRRLFADVSAVQVVATAAAAVTSMLLSSYIGIAGSIIGVAVASVVSTLAASLYKKFLADSAEKIKELPVVAHPSSALAHVLPGHHGSEAHEGDASHEEQPDEEATAGEGPDEAAAAAPTEALAANRGALVADGGALGEDDAEGADEPEGTANSKALEGTGRPDARATAADAKLDPLAALHRQRKLVRGLIVVCIASALLAVAASGAVVYFATMGAGLGQKPAPIYLSAPFTPIDDDDDQASASSAASSAAASSGSAASSSDSSANGNTSDGSTSGGDGTGDGDGSGSPGNTTDPGGDGSDGESGNTTPGGADDGTDKPTLDA